MTAQHIFLTGFMGSGKSTAGKKLASFLKLNFIDLDLLIEKREDKTISFIFDVEGEAVFRQMEADALTEILNTAPPSVIALGGGTVCFGNNLQRIKQSGLLVYIELPAAVLAERLKNSRQPRPLLKQAGGDALLKSIEEKLAQRRDFYAQAHVTISGLNLTPQLLSQQISEARRNNN